MKVLPGGFDINFQISDDPSALFNVCSHVFEVQEELPVGVATFYRAMEIVRGPAHAFFLWARAPLHCISELFHIHSYCLLLFLLQLLDL